MANYKNAKKAIRRAERRRIINKRNMSRLRTYIKKMRKAILNKDVDYIKKHLNETISIIDRTVSKGTIKKNTGARYKSRLMKLANKLLKEMPENQSAN